MMTIEIAGAGFLNKGAELMLRTVVKRLRTQKSDLRLAVAPGVDSWYEQRAALGLASIFPNAMIFPRSLRKLMLRSEAVESMFSLPLKLLMPRAADRILGLVSRIRCDALVDISGYAFGDGFSWTKCRNAATRSHAYAKRGKPIIYLPQMFGPFTNPRVVKYFKQCCEEATRIYAREQASYEAVRSLIGDDDRLRIAPDITIFSSHVASDATEPDTEPYGCLVPNERMLDQGRHEWESNYIPRFIAAGQRMYARGVRPAVVSHSAESQDAVLAEQISDGIDQAIGKGKVIRYSDHDPYGLKSFIGGANYLIGSRFHSVVAALSSGVPAVSLGWAHKYDMLAKDFGVPELQHHGTDPAEHLLSLIDTLSHPETNQELREKILVRRAQMQSSSEAMWADVFSLLGIAE